MGIALRLMAGRFSVCRYPADSPPPSLEGGDLVSITRTEEELSLVCPQGREPGNGDSKVETGWRALRVAGTLDFSEIGVLASLADPLARAEVSIFVVSTYDTDYVLVRDHDLDRALAALTAAGHTIST